MTPTPPTTRRPYSGLLLLILLAYIVTGALFAVLTPAWQSPDEPAHYNYAAQIVTNGCCPVIEPGDWDAAYLDSLKSARFSPERLGNLPTIQYEDHQPPLYYLLGAGVLKLTNGSLIALRLFSVLLGAGVVLCTYAIGRVMLPERPQIGLGAAALVAFLPQHVHILASANNDGLAELIIGLTLLATILYLKNLPFQLAPGSRAYPVRPWLLGGLIGLGLLTKLSTLFLLGLVPLIIVLKGWNDRRTAPMTVLALVRSLALVLIPALLLGGIGWAHNLQVYGFPDIFGQQAHGRVVVGQLRTADLIAEVGWQTYIGMALRTTFNSFWGQFGWMAVPLPEWAYLGIGALLLIAVSGLVRAGIAGRRADPAPGNDTGQRLAWLLLALTALLALLAYLYYNTEFVQFQGRYLYPGLIPLALALAAGLDVWRRWLSGNEERSERRSYSPWITGLVFGGFALLDLYLLWRVLLPGLRV